MHDGGADIVYLTRLTLAAWWCVVVDWWWTGGGIFIVCINHSQILNDSTINPPLPGCLTFEIARNLRVTLVTSGGGHVWVGWQNVMVVYDV